MKSEIEEIFAMQLKFEKILVVREYKFHPERKWRFDFCIPERNIAVECEGGSWVNGRHNRGSGSIADMQKYNHAAALGWFVFRFDGRSVKNGSAIEFLKKVIKK